MARVILLRLCLLMATIGLVCSACTLLTDFKVYDLRVNSETVYSGDKITVKVDVKNSGYIKGDYKVVLKRDGTKWMKENVTLDKDTSREVSFSWVEKPIGQTDKKTIHISVRDLNDSFTLLGRKRMGASVSISADGIVVANTNDYAWMNVKMQLDPGVISGDYVYNWRGPIAPSDNTPDGFVVYWWQFVKDGTSFSFSTEGPQALRITAETEWGDDIMWRGGNVNDSLFEEVVST